MCLEVANYLTGQSCPQVSQTTLGISLEYLAFSLEKTSQSLGGLESPPDRSSGCGDVSEPTIDDP